MKTLVRVPATSANLGSGVDCLGAAFPLFLEAEFETLPALFDGRRFIFVFDAGDGITFMPDDDDNLILRGMNAAEKRTGKSLPPLRVTVHSEIPMSRGLGSSAAATLAGILGGFEVLGVRPDAKTVLSAATEIEGHPDNAAPALLGGVCASMISTDGRVLCESLRCPDVLAVVAVPDFELKTKDARAALPESVPLKDAVAQVQRACMMTAALQNGSFHRLSAASEDLLFTPPRKKFMPYLDRLFRTGKECGALCCMISGAGPSVISFAPDRVSAERIADAWASDFREESIRAKILIMPVSPDGATVASTEE